MSKLVTVSGILTVEADTVVTGQGVDARQIALGPGNSALGAKYYQAVTSTQIDLATAGLVGAAFEDLDVIDELTRVDLLYIRTTAEIAVRLYAVPASAVAVAGVFPTTFAGAETLITTIDGTAVTTTFLIGDQSAAQCVARINAAMALTGIATPRANVVGGQVCLDGVSTAVGSSGDGQFAAFTGTGAAQLGLDAGSSPTITNAQGQDIHVSGLAVLEFPSTGDNVLTNVSISGVATVDVLAAGRS